MPTSAGLLPVIVLTELLAQGCARQLAAPAGNVTYVFSYDRTMVEAERRATLTLPWRDSSTAGGGRLRGATAVVPHDLEIEARGKSVRLPGLREISVRALDDRHSGVDDSAGPLSLDEAIRKAEDYRRRIVGAGWVEGTRPFDRSLT
ncbi:MAG: hypothetical protein ACREQY_16045, partial [Candidatus Binatia bacterium]